METWLWVLGAASVLVPLGMLVAWALIAIYCYEEPSPAVVREPVMFSRITFCPVCHSVVPTGGCIHDGVEVMEWARP